MKNIIETLQTGCVPWKKNIFQWFINLSVQLFIHEDKDGVQKLAAFLLHASQVSMGSSHINDDVSKENSWLLIHTYLQRMAA